MVYFAFPTENQIVINSEVIVWLLPYISRKATGRKNVKLPVPGAVGSGATDSMQEQWVEAVLSDIHGLFSLTETRERQKNTCVQLLTLVLGIL